MKYNDFIDSLDGNDELKNKTREKVQGAIAGKRQSAIRRKRACAALVFCFAVIAISVFIVKGLNAPEPFIPEPTDPPKMEYIKVYLNENPIDEVGRYLETKVIDDKNTVDSLIELLMNSDNKYKSAEGETIDIPNGEYVLELFRQDESVAHIYIITDMLIVDENGKETRYSLSEADRERLLNILES